MPVSRQITEEELEAIAKGGGEVAMDVDMDGAGGEATRRLLGDYQTPARSVHDIRPASPVPRKVSATPRDAAHNGQAHWELMCYHYHHITRFSSVQHSRLGAIQQHFNRRFPTLPVPVLSPPLNLRPIPAADVYMRLQDGDSDAHTTGGDGERAGPGDDGGAEPEPAAAGADAAVRRREPAAVRLRF